MKTPERLESLIEEGLIDKVMHQLMSGKEADIYVVRCGNGFRCAKVYKDSSKRYFQQRFDYLEGRKIRNNRRMRIVEKRNCHTYIARKEAWQSIEVEMLCRLAALGIRVPKFYNFFAGVLLMELVTDCEGNPAPRLSDLLLTPKQARTCHKILINQIVQMLCAGIVHGDLSPYNVLMSNRGPVIIDLPRAVSATEDIQARYIIKRDIDNLTAYFSRFAPELAESDYATEIWSYYQRGELPQAHLTGVAKQRNDPIDIRNVLETIQAVIKKEIAWQRHRQSRYNGYLSQY